MKSQKAKLVPILFVLILVLLVYTWLNKNDFEKENFSRSLYQNKTIKQKKQTTKNPDKIFTDNKVNQAEKEYKIKTRQVITEYLSLVRDKKTTKEKIVYIREKLMNIPVPRKLRNVHINLVLAFYKLEEYLETGNKDAKKQGNLMLQETIEKYAWLQ